MSASVVEVATSVDEELVEAFVRLTPQLSSSSPPPSREVLTEIVESPGDSPRAEACFVEARDVYRSLGDLRAEARVLGYLGNVFRSRREREQAESLYGEAIATFHAQGDPWSEAVFTMDRGILLSAIGDEAAQEVFERALELAVATDNGRCVALIHSHLGAIAADGDRLEEAAAHFEQARARLVDEHDGQFPAVVAVQEHHLALARVRGEGGGKKKLAAVRAALKEEPVIESEHMRLARAILERALLRSAPPDGALRVARDGSWFSHPDRVDLAPHPSLGRLLVALAGADGALHVDALFDVGWPGERAVASARKNRVRVAVSTLRKHGVPITFDRGAGGYMLTTPAVVV